MKIGIIIPFYKNEEQLKKCKKAINELEQYLLPEVFVHDNTKDNVGFTKAVNKGLRWFFYGEFDYAIVLNQDCYLKKNAVKEMTEFMETHSECAIGGTKQISSDDEDFIIHGGCTTPFPEGRHITGFVSKNECNEDKRMPWVNGACMIVRLSALLDIGMMDPNFFLIGSDSDWCYTVRSRGWEVWYIAKAECIHEQGISAHTNDNKLKGILLKDILHFRDKWLTDGEYRELHLEIFK